MNEVLKESIASDQLLHKAPEKDLFDSRDAYDFVSNGQLMVHITLAEYRSLVKQNADQIKSDARSKVYEIEKERDALKKEVADLRKQLDDLRNMIASAVPTKAIIDKGDE